MDVLQTAANPISDLSSKATIGMMITLMVVLVGPNFPFVNRINIPTFVRVGGSNKNHGLAKNKLLSFIHYLKAIELTDRVLERIPSYHATYQPKFSLQIENLKQKEKTFFFGGI